MGMGAMTGRGAGYCAGTGMPGYDNAVPGRNAGLGFGGNRPALGRGGAGRRGWRNRYYVTGQTAGTRFSGNAPSSPFTDPSKEKQLLEQQAKALQSELDLIKKRLGEMETASGT
ncbi:MAG: DUF5320 domain-containing protein [Desulfobulbaceae bacterium]|nr:DUF5320 domain-containing protein [Desulfobulbaceae bacterium]